MFRDMFATSSGDGSTEKDEIRMAEDLEDLLALLPFSYPQDVCPVFYDRTTEGLRRLYEVADKLHLLRAADGIVMVLLRP